MKKEKTVEGLLYSYKENKAELKMLSYRLDLQAVQYDKENVQTSNKSDVSDIVIAREERLNELKKDVNDVECLISTLDEKEKIVIEGYFIEKKTLVELASTIGYYDVKSALRKKEKALIKMKKLYKKVI